MADCSEELILGLCCAIERANTLDGVFSREEEGSDWAARHRKHKGIIIVPTFVLSIKTIDLSLGQAKLAFHDDGESRARVPCFDFRTKTFAHRVGLNENNSIFHNAPLDVFLNYMPPSARVNMREMFVTAFDSVPCKVMLGETGESAMSSSVAIKTFEVEETSLPGGRYQIIVRRGGVVVDQFTRSTMESARRAFGSAGYQLVAWTKGKRIVLQDE